MISAEDFREAYAATSDRVKNNSAMHCFFLLNRFPLPSIEYLAGVMFTAHVGLSSRFKV